MSQIVNTDNANAVLDRSVQICRKRRHEFVTPEHMLLAMMRQNQFCDAVSQYGVKLKTLRKTLMNYLDTLEVVPDIIEYEPEASEQFKTVVLVACDQVYSSSSTSLDVPHLLKGILSLNESTARYMLEHFLGNEDLADFLSTVITVYEQEPGLNENDDQDKPDGDWADGLFGENPDEIDFDLPGFEEDFDDDDDDDNDDDEENTQSSQASNSSWRSLVVCLNDNIDYSHPLIGRDRELERTIQVLCRKDKNNPLHVGEPGVGKTALVRGLAARIEGGDVPQKLSKSRIYQLDMGTLIAGTQFRGDFEKRIKSIMDGLQDEEGAIVYIDEIHTLVGAGQTGEGAMDASNMLKPYLEAGRLRFIGSTTYEEYNRYFAKSKGLVRRFQQIDIPEPAEDEAVRILEGLRQGYESFHGVTYADDAMQYAVHASAKYINDRFLPDKALDLIDEAGAYRHIHPDTNGSNVVDKPLIAEVLAKVCKVDLDQAHDDDNEALMTLQSRMLAQIYGQDMAVTQVVEAVQMAKAGLNDDNKPLASLLFVGPTGVGKTEVARVLAKEMGVELVRFDMSEYTEKHTVAKLIGSPAGYVGYEDGGLLTDAIRKTPHCVLLLDEIEKAHPDIYNILLQVMDYARLTDNKGRKADFRNVILIMTSNAGAQYASRASLGFGANVSAGEAMLAQVKKTFKPEFINRLSASVVFNDMDRTMAGLILDKKLRILQDHLAARKVTLTLTDQARTMLLEKGMTKEYGARELDRVVGRMLKPLLMREILFGRLRQGGNARVDLTDGQLAITDVCTD